MMAGREIERDCHKRSGKVKSHRFGASLLVVMALVCLCVVAWGAQTPGRLALPLGADTPVRGNITDARLTVVWFGDYLSPASRKMDERLKALDEHFPGQVRVYYRHAVQPFHQGGRAIARAAIAAAMQDRFWPFHEALCKTDTSIDDHAVVRAAQVAGLDMKRFEQDRAGAASAQVLESDEALVREAGIDTAPVLVINGVTLVGLPTMDALIKVSERQLSRAQRLNKTGDDLYQTVTRTKPEPYRTQASASIKPEAKNLPIDGSPVLGSPDAPVILVVFTEFQCPFCAGVRQTLDDLHKAYGEQLAIVYKSFPLPFHSHAMSAAKAAVAAQRQGKFWEMHDLLFENQHNLALDALSDYARKLGLDMARFEADFDDPQTEAAIGRDMEMGRKLGVQGTPTFFINGVPLLGARPYEDFVDAIEAALTDLN
jgi:protein-disulfide isomerase